MKMKASVMMVIMLTTILLMSLSIMNFKTNKGMEKKMSPFECGFMNVTNMGTIMFSVPFFMVSLMFLIFDVEILLICLYPMSMSLELYSSLYFWTLVLLILMATLYEWKKGVLKWM